MKIPLIIAFVIPCFLYGQQPSPQSTPQPLPTGPLLKRAPEYSKWVVTYNPPKPGQGKASAEAAKGPPTIKQQAVTKTRGIYHEEVLDTAGVKRDTWRVGALQIVMLPGAQQMILDPSSFGVGGADSSVYTDYSKTDFPGLEWVSKKYYVDIKKLAGVDCMMFKNPPDPAPPVAGQPTPVPTPLPTPSFTSEGDPQSPMVVYINLETRLPVYFQDGINLRVYQISTLPAEMQSLPPNIQSALDSRAKNLEAISKKPSRPY